MTTFVSKTLGPPVSGRYLPGDTLVDAGGARWRCYKGGYPGRWGVDAPFSLVTPQISAYAPVNTYGGLVFPVVETPISGTDSDGKTELALDLTDTFLAPSYLPLISDEDPPVRYLAPILSIETSSVIVDLPYKDGVSYTPIVSATKAYLPEQFSIPRGVLASGKGIRITLTGRQVAPSADVAFLGLHLGDAVGETSVLVGQVGLTDSVANMVDVVLFGDETNFTFMTGIYNQYRAPDPAQYTTERATVEAVSTDADAYKLSFSLQLPNVSPVETAISLGGMTISAL